MSIEAELEVLYDRRAALVSQIEALKEGVASTDARIADLTKDRVAKTYELLGKQSGIVNLALDNGLVVKAEVPKKVTWDTARLRELERHIAPSLAETLFSVKYTIAEKQYDAIEDSQLKQAINAARTVEYGEPKVTLVRKEKP